MTDPLVPIGKGHTELSEEDRRGLIPTYIATRGDLFEAEQRNITDAMVRSRPGLQQILDDKYLRDLHRAMFGKVWEWAGTYRRRETNIGIGPAEIPVAVRTLVDDARAWVDQATYPTDELALRFHHRLVSIHPFPDGNGRHGRVAADLLGSALGGKQFTWGAGLEIETDDLRARYISALRQADDHDIAALLEFARA